LIMANETILIVEDNDITRQGLQIILEAGGFKVLTATQGREALKRMEMNAPDLVLADISMPEMDGYALFKEVRSRPEWITIPFIFLTARGGREDIFNGKKLGVEDYLVKPVDRKELLTTIRSRLARSQQLLLAQLQQAYQASLIMFANAIELRDQYTRGHVERVVDYSQALARQMGWNSSQTNSLRFGSILHDIGKIYIRESILRKPGPLDESEWAEMKRHPVVGAELIKNIPYLAIAIPVVRHHHERWDGKGYPDGLAGEKIPMTARIVMVADALDAMTTSRAYQRKSTPEEAYEEILRCAGTAYDPDVVEALKGCWDEIRVIMP
jgi:putative two-component system response regulator